MRSTLNMSTLIGGSRLARGIILRAVLLASILKRCKRVDEDRGQAMGRWHRLLRRLRRLSLSVVRRTTAKPMGLKDMGIRATALRDMATKDTPNSLR